MSKRKMWPPFPWTWVDNSWQYTTIYDAEGVPVAQLDLENWGVTEDNQDALERKQVEVACLIVKAPEMFDQLEANTKWLIAERDSLYECITDAEGNIPDGEDGDYLREMDKIIDANRALLAEIYGGD